MSDATKCQKCGAGLVADPTGDGFIMVCDLCPSYAELEAALAAAREEIETLRTTVVKMGIFSGDTEIEEWLQVERRLTESQRREVVLRGCWNLTANCCVTCRKCGSRILNRCSKSGKR